MDKKMTQEEMVKEAVEEAKKSGRGTGTPLRKQREKRQKRLQRQRVWMLLRRRRSY